MCRKKCCSGILVLLVLTGFSEAHSQYLMDFHINYIGGTPVNEFREQINNVAKGITLGVQLTDPLRYRNVSAGLELGYMNLGQMADNIDPIVPCPEFGSFWPHGGLGPPDIHMLYLRISFRYQGFLGPLRPYIEGSVGGHTLTPYKEQPDGTRRGEFLGGKASSASLGFGGGTMIRVMGKTEGVRLSLNISMRYLIAGVTEVPRPCHG